MKLTKTLSTVLLAGLGFSHLSQAQSSSVQVSKVLLDNIGSPWGMAFISNDQLLFTEKQGKVWRYVISTNTKTEITGLPSINQNGQGGLLDLALHPDFSENSFVYLTYAVAATGGQTTALGRGKLVGNQLQNFTELFRALPVVNSGVHFGSRIAFDRQKRIYVSVGERGTGTNSQNTNIHLGKIIRLNDDGSIPADNPFVGVPNTKPEIFSYGHRNIQGLAMNPVTGDMYAHEHGPRGGDELNILKKGANYGWPVITFGINYDGTPITPDTSKTGMEQPLTYWVPSIAPSGLVFLQSGNSTNEFEVLIGALVGTHVHWLKMKDNKKVWSTYSLQNYARFRDLEQAPDGKLYALTETPNRLVLLQPNVVVTGLEENSPEIYGATIHPNPSSLHATLTFQLNTTEHVSIKIHTQNGTLVGQPIEAMFETGQHSVSLDNSLPKGLYHVEVMKNNKKTMLKWIKN